MARYAILIRFALTWGLVYSLVFLTLNEILGLKYPVLIVINLGVAVLTGLLFTWLVMPALIYGRSDFIWPSIKKRSKRLWRKAMT